MQEDNGNGHPLDPGSFGWTQGRILRNLEADGLNAEYVESLRTKAGTVHAVLQKFHAKRRELGDSGKYTESGLADALADLASKAAAEIRRVCDDSHLRNNIRQTEAQLRPPAGDPIAQLGDLWRAMEIRQIFLSQGLADDPVRAAMAYRDAMQRGDHLTMQALETWPLGSPVKDLTLLAEGRAARQAASDPVGARKLQDLQTFHEVLTQLTKDAIGELPLNAPDPIAQQASGSGDA
jgi:hypothetical protein